MAQNYAYLDQYGILHLHDEEHAKQHGKHVATELQADESGYPVVEGNGVVYYSNEDAAYIKGNRKDGQRISTPAVIKQIADQLK
ncbi:hypothetical protein L8C07_12435 [Paenibacillus sp. CMAA1739]|uniref:hypothetical protein n=1 Tax=Paenibacillus ottowii TaxID=2315729 RepID=UPI002DB9C637|nr:hypothetical protein [Paenibacillus sp. CMAA1739]MEC4566755.1 hypothetical protein [Paenibacillus sp. CMAA1739]